jgi:hypothetical protein
MLPVFVEVGLCAFGEKDQPGFLEIGARLVEGGGGAGRAFPWMAARIEAAAPAPRIGVSRVARADRDRADTDVAIVDLPGLLLGIWGWWRRVRAGMALLKRGTTQSSNCDPP